MRTFKVVVPEEQLEDFEVIIEADSGRVARFAISDEGSIYFKFFSAGRSDTEVELDDEGELVSFVRV